MSVAFSDTSASHGALLFVVANDFIFTLSLSVDTSSLLSAMSLSVASGLLSAIFLSIGASSFLSIVSLSIAGGSLTIIFLSINTDDCLFTMSLLVDTSNLSFFIAGSAFLSIHSSLFFLLGTLSCTLCCFIFSLSTLPSFFTTIS